MERTGELEDEEKWVYDSSVDHEGKVPLRDSTGAWKAALFILAVEFSERLCYFGIATNLIIYLTKVLHQDVKTAAKNVNNWIGVTTMMPLIGGFVADAYLGRFCTILVSSVVYLGGLLLLIMSQLIPSLKPCDTNACTKPSRIHEVVFFVAMYLISIGTGGHKPSLESFGADQFDDNHAEERKKKMSYFNWWGCGVCTGLVLGVTIIVYVQDNLSWGTADIIVTVVMGISLVVILIGRRRYRYRLPQGSPLTPILQVLVAAMAKRHLPLPSDAGELYEVSRTDKSNTRLLCHTTQFRYLDKAAIIVEHEGNDQPNHWRLATVTQVEEMKLVLSIIPIWLSALPFGICVAQASTFFIKQGSIMNRKITGGFEIPPASLYSFAALSMTVSVCFYDRTLVPFLRRVTGNQRGMSILQRIGTGMAFAIAGMAVSAIVEKKRVRMSENMSVFWLVPQFTILGVADGLTLVGLQEYFYDQVPDRMRSLGIAFYLSTMGAASFLSNLLITVVDNLTATEIRGQGWIAKDLNKSRLDKFYWLIAAINGVNIGVYVYIARKYSYKNIVKTRVGVMDSSFQRGCHDNHVNV